MEYKKVLCLQSTHKSCEKLNGFFFCPYNLFLQHKQTTDTNASIDHDAFT